MEMGKRRLKNKAAVIGGAVGGGIGGTIGGAMGFHPVLIGVSAAILGAVMALISDLTCSELQIHSGR
jgi:uncharacterized membrane protein